MMNTPHSEPHTILKAFEKLYADYQQQADQIATKQDIAARQRDQELVEQASTYTPENIFQALAKLQSTFSQSTDELAQAMTVEVEKLMQIQRSIQVETQHLETLHHIQIAAEAFNILQQEHQKTLQNLAEERQQQQETLEKQIAKQREIWQGFQQVYEDNKKKQQTLLEKNRHNEEEEYSYKYQRQHTEEANDYEKRKRALERQLEEEKQRKEKDWQARESYLEQHQTEFEEYQAKVEAIPQEIETAMKKAREEAIKETYHEEENKAKLKEKEIAAKRRAFELKLESLNKTVDRQRIQIAQLTEQLQAASQQMQQLAMTAVASTGQSTTTGSKKAS